jgi:hypothetical protein
VFVCVWIGFVIGHGLDDEDVEMVSGKESG